LRRDGEMVCRATSGSTAPDLGSRLDTSLGLSAECLRTLRTQRCNDVLTDARADAEASLRLGVRSVIVMPLVRGEELLGFLELFSPKPFAFGDRDERTLEALAGRVLLSLERSQLPLPAVEVPPAEGPPVSDNSEVPATGETGTGSRRFDVLSLLLAAAVLACAVLLGVLLGRRFEALKTKARTHPVTPSATVVGTRAPTVTTAGSSPSGTVENEGKPAPPAASSKPRAANSVPPGGLLVLENGKVIFRMPSMPAESMSADLQTGMQRAAAVEPEKTDHAVEPPPAAAGRVLYRVEPEYPAEAQAQKIQGAVVLQVQIGADGKVEGVQVVSGPAQLAQAAVDAVKQWRFEPSKSQGHLAEMQTKITLSFRLPP
ncbi:MAG TPA: TonB family protein, partial [Candidatus Sulfotelmatobacter sp.]|nr:TonB family protein [Candidatus Sulfotelmatobacter sp.]